jgi:hypothetical protein
MSDKAKAGDPLSISAVTWNKMVDLVTPQVGGEAGRGTEQQPYLWCYARNDTGGAVVRGDASLITGVVADEATNASQYLYKPVAVCTGLVATSLEDVVVWLEPVAAGKFGKVAVSGVCIARVNVTSSGGFARVGSGVLEATVEPSPIAILFRPSGSAVQNCLVRLMGGSAHQLACDDVNRFVTEIEWASPILRYRKGPNCSWVTILTGTTCSGPSAAPTGLAAPSTTTTSVSLTWTDTASNEDGYEVQRKLNSGSVWTVVTVTAADATSHTVTGLTAGTAYDFRVRAVNVYGESTWNTITNISTNAES